MKKVVFISSTGGHLSELLQLKPLFKKYNSYLITEKTKSNINLKYKFNNVNYLIYGTKDHKFSYLFKFSYNCIHNAYGDSTKELYEIIMNNDFENADIEGNVKDVDIKNDYIEMIASGIKLGDRKLKVIYDCGNGTTSVVADSIFNKFKKYFK